MSAPELSCSQLRESSLTSHFLPAASLIWNPTLTPLCFACLIVHGFGGRKTESGPCAISETGTARTALRFVNHDEFGTSSNALTFTASRCVLPPRVRTAHRSL